LLIFQHIERIKTLLDDSRKIDPTLPSWDSLLKNEYFIDKFGFKYEKKSELHHLHYICQQLSTFYSTQPNIIEEDLLRSRLRSWKSSFKKDDEIKHLLRSGMASNYRKDIWTVLIRDATKDIRKRKGANYYLYLCQLASKSSVSAFELIFLF